MKGIVSFLRLLPVAICLLFAQQSLSVENWVERGLSLLKSERFEDAIEAFSIAIEGMPDESRAYNYRGVAWFYKGNYDRAIADCTRAVELNPRYADAYHQLALVLAVCPDKRYRNATKAVELAQRAVELKPEANFLDTLAAAYAEAGRFGNAIETQKRAIALLRKDGETGELAGYIGRLRSYEAQRPLGERYIALRQESGRDAFKELDATAEGGKSTYPYTIQICSLRYRERSNRVVTRLRKKGDLAFTSPAHIPGKGDWHRVFIGFYETLEEARMAALALKKRRFRYANVVKKPYAIQVGLSDSGEELKKLEADLRPKGYQPYSIRDGQANGRIRLLIGAFRTEKEAASLIKTLQEEGFKPRVVER